MEPFDYLLTFAAIVMGIAVSDVFVSLNRLLAAGSRVKWDWLGPLAALAALLKILTQWWAWYSVRGSAPAVTFELFALLVASVGLLFLMSSAALPDEVGPEGVDLKDSFAAASRRYFLLFALHTPLLWLFVWGLSQRSDYPAPYLFNLGHLAPATALILVFVRNRWAQGGFLAAMCGLYLWQGFGHPLPS
ncbi:hypothetical protein QO010_003465 [Caulobacter ginsengisoli]|uniref:Uncharacterized protein n=1 Tax=Caulobacter ginsengisoli TaxID=400775 RepID=A0ABU0IWF5_9CAUL|nr:hypothetical protein [Caulobacter ginsengisoli]MDQ0465676.1 hypothetical protein [Caulobacter ginsengisoli]